MITVKTFKAPRHFDCKKGVLNKPILDLNLDQFALEKIEIGAVALN